MLSPLPRDPSTLELLERARTTARGLLQPLGDRWAHVQGVVRVAEQVSCVVEESERPYLIAAAFLHDIGYAPAAVQTGFHPLDGALYLVARRESWRVCCLVAHHSAARYEARARNLHAELANFDREESALMDALVYADMTTGPTGAQIGIEARLTDVRNRYAGDDPVSKALRAAESSLEASISRTQERLRVL